VSSSLGKKVFRPKHETSTRLHGFISQKILTAIWQLHVGTELLTVVTVRNIVIWNVVHRVVHQQFPDILDKLTASIF
jgi:hypothetical protein